MQKLFNNHIKLKVKSSLSKYQESLFKRLWDFTSVVFAKEITNLGPVEVLLTKYIKDGLIHLQTPPTYAILSKAKRLNLKVQSCGNRCINGRSSEGSL